MHEVKFSYAGLELLESDLLDIPIIILGTNETIPALITTSPYVAEVDNNTRNAFYIVWDFGTVTNPLLNNDTLMVLRFSGVVLDSASSDVQFDVTGTSFLSNFEVATASVNISVVEPFLITDVTNKVMAVTINDQSYRD